ncbi:MAG: SIS domain-containing protein [Oligoflexia bacterium]|nr:SIS domain-containing protein [Oligoflexia bacterium]
MNHQDPRSKNYYPESTSIKDYLSKYVSSVSELLNSLDSASLDKATDSIFNCIGENRTIFVGGNGGSSAIADHLLCDWVKGTCIQHKEHNLKVFSLNSSPSLLTAVANDYGYEHTLSYPLEIYGKNGDVVVLISSSGNSPNIINAAKLALKKNMTIIGLTGFSGGELKHLSTINLHIPIENYGMVEDAHQMIMHVIAQQVFLKRTL